MIAPTSFRPKILKKVDRLARQHLKNSGFRCKHFSAVVRRNKILAIGVNENKTDPFSLRCNFPFAYKHSETAAIKNLEKLGLEPKGLILINYRLSGGLWRDATPALCRPCKFCLQFARKVGISTIFYTTENGNFARIDL